MRDDILIKFMQEVSNQLGTFGAELKEINRRLDEGALKMSDGDKFHDEVAREIDALKVCDVSIQESVSKNEKAIETMKVELQPVVDFGKTVSNNRKFVIYVATFVSAIGIIVGGVVVGIEKLRGH